MEPSRSCIFKKFNGREVADHWSGGKWQRDPRSHRYHFSLLSLLPFSASISTQFSLPILRLDLSNKLLTHPLTHPPTHPLSLCFICLLKFEFNRVIASTGSVLYFYPIFCAVLDRILGVFSDSDVVPAFNFVYVVCLDGFGEFCGEMGYSWNLIHLVFEICDDGYSLMKGGFRLFEFGGLWG
ncbi:hypothetical protein SDJN03_22248, partial [Cucurbita argyrosperma subsp. sororia]